jgi:OmpA-OmpF porin, OOP family
MEIRPLPAHITHRLWSLCRAAAPALLFSLIPLGTAYAQPPASQPYGWVQVNEDRTEIECFGKRSRTCLVATQGTLLEVLFIDGDRYHHKKSNWYWVMLPQDQWGRKVTGWIKGNKIEHVQMPESSSSATASLTLAPRVTDETASGKEAITVPVAEAPAAARAVLGDVVLNFEFDKSTLTDEAVRKLESAVAWTTTPGQGVAVALSGHADGIGRESYNDQLGAARAETVRRFLMEKLGIPAESITVTSYGERQPVAPNKTRDGRAKNRRVELKGSGS